MGCVNVLLFLNGQHSVLWVVFSSALILLHSMDIVNKKEQLLGLTEYTNSLTSLTLCQKCAYRFLSVLFGWWFLLQLPAA